MLMWYQDVMPISTSVKVCNWHFVLPYIVLLIWALSRMSLVNPINKLAALLVYWWAKLLSSVTIEEYVSYRYLELGRSSYLEFISASSICNLEFSMSFKQHTQQNRSCIFSFFVTLFCVWWVPHNVWWGLRAHQTFCLMEHQTFSPTLMMVRLLSHICITRPQWVNNGNHYVWKEVTDIGTMIRIHLKMMNTHGYITYTHWDKDHTVLLIWTKRHRMMCKTNKN